MEVKNNEGKKRSLKKAYIAGGLAAAIVVVIAGTSIYYNNKFYPHTSINGIDVSGKTVSEATKVLDDYVSSYTLTTTAREDSKSNSGSLEIKGSDIDLSVDYNGEVESSFKDQHKSLAIFNLFSTNDIDADFDVSYSKDSVKDIISDSELVKGSKSYKVTAPTDAKVVYDDSTKAGKIVAETLGNKLNTKKFIAYEEKEIEALASETDITDNEMDVYKNPNYYEDDEAIQNELTTYNGMLYHYITWDMGEDHLETMTPDDIKDMLIIGKKANVKIDEDKLEDWIETFCLKYKTYGATRKFTTHDGKTINISGGDFGWRLDFDQTVDQAKEALKELTSTKKIEAYQEEQSDDTTNAITTTLEPIWAYKGQVMNYDNPTADWDTENYSEVDLSDQKVYVYKNGKLAYSCICVTGLKSDPERRTKTGVWYIKDKKLTYTLTGDDYSTPTKYWVRIMWTGTGYHYMNRSDWGSWSPNTYKVRGSHGCVNLQYNSAKTIYGLVDLGDAVFIHQ